MAKRQAAMREIDNLYSDTSQPASDTLDDLEHILEHVESMIQTLRDEGVKSSAE